MSSPTIPHQLIEKIKQAQHIVVFTGAGISAESGVPTFRDAQTGLWAKYDPLELATPEAFQRDPKLVWEWYAWRREKINHVKPNAGHLALVELAQQVPQFTLITQNVDGLHQQAGSQNVIELHGNIHRIKCANKQNVVENWQQLDGSPPECPLCGDHLRPDIVWFGEALPVDAISNAFAAAEQCDVLFSIGTSSLVQPAASIPLEALQHGATVVEINPNPTPLTEQVTFSILGQAGQILPTLIRQLTA
ncbi:NAD-dependent deacylase [Candidatus Albibeggiatoa sp. nov. NOAA]|uniref:SIR2 family NAD-dependent protein deacylase n=1 Tax=Candidatus Albibeggiatoa sp. nov. NOAA TaxID=3162724 RepID=UPI0032F22B34|nr:NAD-dependent deacylase [Thiotrichaceae bacterium]